MVEANSSVTEILDALRSSIADKKEKATDSFSKLKLSQHHESSINPELSADARLRDVVNRVRAGLQGIVHHDPQAPEETIPNAALPYNLENKNSQIS